MNTLSSFSLNLRKTLSRISAGLLAAVLLASGTPSALGAPSAQVSGDADVVITHISRLAQLQRRRGLGGNH